MRTLGRQQLMGLLDGEEITEIERSAMSDWLLRGDGIAVYRDDETGSPTEGTYQFIQIEGEVEPSERLENVAYTNRNFRLFGVFRERAVIER